MRVQVDSAGECSLWQPQLRALANGTARRTQTPELLDESFEYVHSLTDERVKNREATDLDVMGNMGLLTYTLWNDTHKGSHGSDYVFRLYCAREDLHPDADVYSRLSADGDALGDEAGLKQGDDDAVKAADEGEESGECADTDEMESTSGSPTGAEPPAWALLAQSEVMGLSGGRQAAMRARLSRLQARRAARAATEDTAQLSRLAAEVVALLHEEADALSEAEIRSLEGVAELLAQADEVEDDPDSSSSAAVDEALVQALVAGITTGHA